MAVYYKLQQKVNPRDTDGERKWYARIISQKRVMIEELAERISARVTAQRADVEAVLAAIQPLFRQNLVNGKVVKLSQLGNWRIVLVGAGETTEELYDTSLVRRAKVNFLPAVGLKTKLRVEGKDKIEFKRVTFETGTDDDEEGGII